MKAAVVVDDWKLPVFRRCLTEAGYTYADAGEGVTPATTILHVQFTDQAALTKVLEGAADECKRTGKPRGRG